MIDKSHVFRSRRKAIQNLLGLTAAIIPGDIQRSVRFLPKTSDQARSTTIGFITDLHHGLCDDATERLQVFIDHCSTKELDFILQCGDFCHPTADAIDFLEIWNSYDGQRYHVLGNHDMDKGTKEDIMFMWGIRATYYSFDQGELHFVVLDGNYILEDGKYVNYANANFYIDQEKRSLVNPEQIEWLREDLANTDKQTFIFSHQAFDEVWDGWSSPSRLAVRDVLEEANANSPFQKVIACFCGHHHLDEHSIINQVHYFQMNSASYYWAGDGYGSDGPMAMYEDAVYAFITIDPRGKIIIEGKQSKFSNPTPKETNHPDADKLSASIQDRTTTF